MLSLKQIDIVWTWIRSLPAKDRPQEVRHVFDLVLLHLEPNTGLVLLRRDEIAERMGCAVRTVSSAMSVLERAGVISRAVSRVPGLKGPGVVVYSVNPQVAWNGRLDDRQAAASKRKPPLLRLMEPAP